MKSKNKKRVKYSPIWKPSPEEMQNILNSHDSYSDVVRYFGMNPRNGSVKTLHSRIKEDGLDDSYIQSKPWIKNTVINMRNKKYLNENMIFCVNSTANRSYAKRKIIKDKLLPYICDDCGNTGEWNGSKLSLQLEHKNGINDDHRLENLCFLCPNCHSQTKTYAGKQQKKRKTKQCVECENLIQDNSTRCKKCASKLNGVKKVISWPTYEDFVNLIWSKPMVFIAKELGVSDVAVRKRCRKLNVEVPPRGHWLKK